MLKIVLNCLQNAETALIKNTILTRFKSDSCSQLFQRLGELLGSSKENCFQVTKFSFELLKTSNLFKHVQIRLIVIWVVCIVL